MVLSYICNVVNRTYLNERRNLRPFFSHLLSVLHNGRWYEIDLYLFLVDVAMPLYTAVMDLTIAPYFLCRILGCFVDSYESRAFFHRWSILTTFLAMILVRGLIWGKQQYLRWKDQKLESKYLLRKELENRVESS